VADQARRERGAPIGGGAGGPLSGRVAIVTGAAGGLGSATVRALRQAGTAVVPVDVHGDDCLIADVATAGGNRQMIDLAVERHGRLDILVLNAGAQAMNPIASYAEADWDRLMNLMVKGPFLAMKFAWPQLTRQPGGRIIVTSSTAGLTGAPYKAAYVAAKHAVLGLVKVAALEGAGAGLTANAVASGWMRTPLADNQIRDHIRLRGISRDDVIAGMMAEQPAGRFVDPAEVAGLSRSWPARTDRRSTAPASRSTPARSPAEARRARRRLAARANAPATVRRPPRRPPPYGRPRPSQTSLTIPAVTAKQGTPLPVLVPATPRTRPRLRTGPGPQRPGKGTWAGPGHQAGIIPLPAATAGTTSR
jgi:3-hydroxybutyrate dehydrogenase